jgi:hypothetical protein
MKGEAEEEEMQIALYREGKKKCLTAFIHSMALNCLCNVVEGQTE